MTRCDRMTGRAAAAVASMMLAACGDGGTAEVANRTVPATEAPAVPDTAEAQTQAEGAREFFLGTWTGPEGLSFVVEHGADGGYRVRNQDTLDTRTTFAATRDGGTLRFVRRGQALTARPGTGAETGFKWLANKRDCLIVQANIEGYCRD